MEFLKLNKVLPIKQTRQKIDSVIYFFVENDLILNIYV